MITEQKIRGNCLEGIGIPVEGIAVIDTELNPEVFDVVWCDGVLAGSIGGFLKQIIKTGKHSVVHTCYKNGTKDYACHPAQIYGVVLRVMDEKRNTVWERQPVTDVVEVVHSKWEINSDGYYPFCKHCNHEPKNGVMSNYCPDCGAKMDGKGSAL